MSEIVNILIEVPKGSRNKYEYDAELGAIKLDRFLFSSMVYPVDYGMVPDTLGADGEEGEPDHPPRPDFARSVGADGDQVRRQRCEGQHDERVVGEGSEQADGVGGQPANPEHGQDPAS